MHVFSDFIFVRHGETDWNASGLFQGRTDIALNANGVRQAHRAAQRLKTLDISKIVSSPLSRAIDTAAIIARAMNLTTKTDDNLIECDFGSLEGQSIREAMTHHDITRLEQLAEILPEDGEQWADVRARSLAALTGLLLPRMAALTVLVGHDAVLQAISEQLCGHWFKSQHATPYLFALSDGSWARTELS
ncbi:fructose-2,6-bisphosphatase [Hoeflea sp. IMCC20628]|uniref:histidine phosphatase family protein n=1 Tax=Hoeflea sp. IMCC20628 TaxID=1620421 RepID=UPI00063AFC1B|nr:histidine phosphatase family protein [Hoeflea sp. IMCC20628]AKI01271.1 fructose-2,6-bisphosphatase [Hoeflea sp. IMCC20628]